MPMLETGAILQLLRQNQDYLRERFGLQSLVLFGSYARNQQHEGSDIDLLYQLLPGKTMPLMRLQNLEQYIGGLVQQSKVELVSGRHAGPIIGMAIQKGGIVVF